MDDRAFVRVVKSLQDTVHDGEGLGQRDRPLVDPLAQRFPAHKLEHDVVGFSDLLEVVDLHQVGVARPGHHLRFLHESRQCGRIRGRGRDELFDGDFAAKAKLLGQVDGPHPTSAKLALDQILADLARRCHGWRRGGGRRRRRGRRHHRLDGRDQAHGGGDFERRWRGWHRRRGRGRGRRWRRRWRWCRCRWGRFATRGRSPLGHGRLLLVGSVFGASTRVGHLDRSVSEYVLHESEPPR